MGSNHSHTFRPITKKYAQLERYQNNEYFNKLVKLVNKKQQMMVDFVHELVSENYWNIIEVESIIMEPNDPDIFTKVTVVLKNPEIDHALIIVNLNRNAQSVLVGYDNDDLRACRSINEMRLATLAETKRP